MHVTKLSILPVMVLWIQCYAAFWNKSTVFTSNKSVWRKDQVHVKMMLHHRGLRDPESEGDAAERKKDKEEEVSSPDFVMQVLCFLGTGACSDTTIAIVF